MVTAVGTATALVVTANVFVVALAATVTEAGTVAALVLLLVSAPRHRPPAPRAKRHRTGAARGATRHAVGLTAHADQSDRRIHRQRRGPGYAAVGGREGHGRRDRHRTGGDRERFRCRPCSHRHGGRHRRCIGVTARQRDNGTARRRRGAKRDGTGAISAPPVTAVGLTLTPTRATGGFTVSVAVLATPL